MGVALAMQMTTWFPDLITATKVGARAASGEGPAEGQVPGRHVAPSKDWGGGAWHLWGLAGANDYSGFSQNANEMVLMSVCV